MSTDTTEQLDQLLADYTVYSQRLRNFHWNVRGKRFFQLHEEFERLYNQASTFGDDIAERIARLGDKPTSTLGGLVQKARLEEQQDQLGADAMVRRLIQDIENVNRFATKTINTADSEDDVATCNLLEDMVQQQEENAWMLSSWLNE